MFQPYLKVAPMDFSSYNSIKNVNSSEFHNAVNSVYNKRVWGIYEKLDGANIQISFQKDGSYLVGSRNRWIMEGEDFYDIWNTLNKVQNVLNAFKGKELTLFGEIYGKGIQKRIHYGDEKYIKFFDIRNPNYISYDSVLSVASILNISDAFVQPLHFFDSLEEAANFNVEVMHGEGIIIKPVYEPLFLGCHRLIFKKKRESFNERVQRKEKPTIEGDPLHEIFCSYINENRMYSVFSKNGKIKSIDQLSSYIKLILDDAKKDFLEENDVPEDVDLKKIFNVGSKIATMLKGTL